MGRPPSRRKSAARAKTPSFSFSTKRLRGVKPETKAERDDATRMKAEFVRKFGVKRK